MPSIPLAAHLDVVELLRSICQMGGAVVRERMGMGIGVARLAAGSLGVNLGSGLNPSRMAQLYTDDEPDIRAVVKDLSPRQLANELIAASVISKLSLPAPRSFLVFAKPEDAFGSAQISHASGLKIYFGSELSSHKDFYTFFNMDAAMAFNALINFPGWGTMLAFDEWFANIDRHLKNFMYDGATIYLFDHDRVFTGPAWKPSDLVANANHQCHQLVTALHQAMTNTHRKAAKDLADAFSQLALKIDIDEALIESHASEIENGIPQDLPAVEQFLKARVSNISTLSEQRLAAGGPF